MRVTLAQLSVYDDIGKNLAGIKEAALQAANERAHIMLTPEGALSGYTPHFDVVSQRDALAEITAFAAERKLGLALGTCMVEDDGLCYNQVRFYTPGGEYLGFHSKTLRCGSGLPPVGEVNDYAVQPLQVFQFQGITVAGLICNDMWANPSCTPMPDPNLVQQLTRMGATVIFQAVNGGRDASAFSQGLMRDYHEVHVLIKSKFHDVTICTVDNAYPEHIGVSSIGGVAKNGEWAYRLPMVGRQVVTIEV